jgi:hypothetical protein
MPEAKTILRARKAQRQGKAPTTAAGEFVREEIEHVRQGKHGVRSPRQAIAIGMSKARRSGIKVGTPKRGRASARTRRQAERDQQVGRTRRRATSPRRARAAARTLRREGRQAVSPRSLSAQARRGVRARKAAGQSQTSSRTRQQGSAKRRGGRSARSRTSAT